MPRLASPAHDVAEQRKLARRGWLRLVRRIRYRAVPRRGYNAPGTALIIIGGA